MHPEDRARRGLGGGGIAGELDPPALAAAAGMDLGLHHDAAAQLLGNGPGGSGSVGHVARRHGHAELPEDRLRLALANLHGRRAFAPSPHPTQTPLTSSPLPPTP